ncbi:MAG: phosphoribosylamine--glycine ligase [Deltaproteobacteria bacterium]|nr:phosphoribosylamine--glycine ligase [Deltaproteobacteria bacterium]
MRIMLIGSGGREHALAWKIRQSEMVEEVLCVPGNGGLKAEPKVRCLKEPGTQAEWLELARAEGVDLVVIGPEAHLVNGLAGAFRAAGIAAVGPDADAAALEGSKVFAKLFMRRHGIPTADFQVFTDHQSAVAFLEANRRPLVVKADGLAAGKGVFPCRDTAEALAAIQRIMQERAFGEAGASVVIEEFLEGEEASCIALTDGRNIRLLASSQDHKRLLDGDRGPNTGGMGAYSPAPVLSQELEARVVEEVFRPVVEGMRKDGRHFSGILYAGLMIDGAELKVLEYNVRFGDPETQALLPRLRSDLVPALAAVAGMGGDLKKVELDWSEDACVCVVMASEGYPGPVTRDVPIEGLEAAGALAQSVVFHAGTRFEAGRHLTSGGRVLGVCGLGVDVAVAVERSYGAVDRIHFDGAFFRRDIAHRALTRRT